MPKPSVAMLVLCGLVLALDPQAAWGQSECQPATEERDCPFGECVRTGQATSPECEPAGVPFGCDEDKDVKGFPCSLFCTVETFNIYSCGVISCDEDPDCVNGGRCAFGVCQECAQDSHCGRGEVCIGSSCIDRPEGFCRTSGECPKGFRCTGGRPGSRICEEYGGRCESDHDCAAGKCFAGVTIRGKFFPSGVCLQLLASSTRCIKDDCPAGFFCAYGACVRLVHPRTVRDLDELELCLPNPDCPGSGKCGGSGGIMDCPPPRQ